MSKKSLVLMGIKHCGKTTQGKLLASHFNCKFYDTDDEIKLCTGKTPREIYTEKGQNGFLEAEETACKNLAAKLNEEFAVIATGGGICNNEKALEILRKIGTLVFLNADEKTACDRILKEIAIGQDGTLQNLPAYIAKENPQTIEDVKNIFHKFYEERQKIYESICDIKVNMLPVSKAENMGHILKSIR